MSLIGNAAVITIGATLASNYYSTFANAESKAVKLGEAYKQTQAKINVLNSIPKYEKQLNALDGMHKSGIVNADEYAKSQKKIQKELDKTRQEAIKLGIPMEKLGSTYYNSLVKDDHKLSRRIAGLGMYNTAKAGIKQTWFGVAAAAGSVGLPVKLADDFEKSMARIKVVIGATDIEFKAMNSTARMLGRASEFGSVGVAGGMLSLAQQGYKTNQIIGMMPGILDLAAASMTELGETSAIAGTILRDFSLNSEKMPHVANVLAKTISTCGTTLQELGSAMNEVGPMADALNVSLEQTAGFLGFLAKNGIKGTEAAGALKGMLNGLVKESGEGGRMLRNLGVEARDLDGNLRPLGDIMADLNMGIENQGLGDADRLEAMNAIFGERAGAKIAGVFKKGNVAEINKMTESYKNNDDAVKALAKANNETFWGSVQKLKSGLGDIGISIGQVLLPPLRVFTDILSFALVPIGNFIEENKIFTTTISWLVVGLLMWTKVLPLVGFGIRMLGGAIMANPIGLVIGIIALGLDLIITYWDPICKGVMWVVDAIGTALGWGWQAVKFLFFFLTPIGLVVTAFEFLINKIDCVGKAWKWVKGLFGFGDKTAVPEIGSAVKPVAGSDTAQNANADANAVEEARARELARQVQESSAARKVSSQKQINNNQTITIHTQPGQSPDEIADLVMKRQQETDEQDEQGNLYDNELSFA